MKYLFVYVDSFNTHKGRLFILFLVFIMIALIFIAMRSRSVKKAFKYKFSA